MPPRSASTSQAARRPTPSLPSSAASSRHSSTPSMPSGRPMTWARASVPPPSRSAPRRRDWPRCRARSRRQARSGPRASTRRNRSAGPRACSGGRSGPSSALRRPSPSSRSDSGTSSCVIRSTTCRRIATASRRSSTRPPGRVRRSPCWRPRREPVLLALPRWAPTAASRWSCMSSRRRPAPRSTRPGSSGPRVRRCRSAGSRSAPAGRRGSRLPTPRSGTA